MRDKAETKGHHLQTIAQRFAVIAERYPGRIALKYRNQNAWGQYTYAQLLQEAQHIAAYLAGVGVRSGEAVILPALRTHSLCSALLGILWGGGHYVFIDPEYPAERQKLIAEAVGAKIGLFEDEGSILKNLNLNWHQMPPAGSKGKLPDIAADPDAAACVFFTSGSTGIPKGVVVPHRGIIRLVVDTDYISFSENEVFLQLSTLSFDAATLEIWGPLLNGGTCVLHFEHGALTPGGIQDSIESQGVTTVWLTSSLFNAVISGHPQVLKSVKQLLTGGESLSVSHIKKGLALLPDTRLYNGYGPTENTTFTTIYPIPHSLPKDIKRIPIGFPILGTTCELFDEHLQPVMNGQAGELIAFGDGLALGYLKREELTAERFIDIACADGIRRKGYRTGDLVVKNEDGSYDFIQRNDKQVKIDGHRIEPGEIELFLNELENIVEARVVVRIGPNGQKRLAAYLVGKTAVERSSLREQLSEHFPPYMVPHFIVPMKALPKNQNGKLDESRLPDPFADSAVQKTGHHTVASCWKEVLGRAVAADENFLDAGGTSLEALQVAELLEKRFGVELSATFVFEYPTINSQAVFFQCDQPSVGETPFDFSPTNETVEFAIIGMACRFPGADSVDEYWNNLIGGKETISFFREDELSNGVDPIESGLPGYVRAKGIVNNYDKFDAAFFGISPIEADIMDPQQRIMLELCWHALEDAGIPPGDQHRRTGVFLGMNWARYYQQYVLPNKEILARFGVFNSALANESDFLTTRISYKLNLKGPSINVFTACSTGLVAVAQACAAIEQGQCEQAIAGGVSISTPVKSGYLYQEGNMLSRDGHCRPFDANATGTTFNDGAGAVVIKRRDMAEADGDQIYAIIKGFAVNNDGEQKASFTAPSVSGQVMVYDAALKRAHIDPQSIGFIETHGTATPLGDPIEVHALCQSYAKDGRKEKTCALGSVKSNIGHTIHAAGIASLIKTVLSVQTNAIPPTLFFQQPNPKLELEKTPFFINNTVIPWPGPSPRRAAVSSLGVGGTNAHILLEQYNPAASAPAQHEPIGETAAKKMYSILLSAKSQESLDRQIANYHQFFQKTSGELPLRDAAYTSALGRKHFAYRAVASGDTIQDIIGQFADKKLLVHGKTHDRPDGKICFMFSGQGAQRVGMGRWLYEHDTDFQALFDRGCEIVLAKEGIDIRSALFADGEISQHGLDVHQTNIAQPALFLLEYGLARFFMDKGCRPDFFIGHSIGEFTAAALAGVFHFDDAVALVARRGALMQSMPTGQMLSVKSEPAAVSEFLGDEVALAAINAPNLIVLAGATERMQQVAKLLTDRGIASTILRTSHAFHSHLMEPMVSEFEAVVAAVPRGHLDLPIYSTKTGKLLHAEEAASPSYWASQLRSSVLFSEAVTAVARDHADHSVAYVEIGPGTTLATLVSCHPQQEAMTVIAALPGGGVNRRAQGELCECMSRLWVKGYPLQWQAVYPPGKVKKIRLPGYAFSRELHWLKRPGDSARLESAEIATSMQSGICTQAQEVEMNQEQHVSDIGQQLKSLLEDITGYDLADMDEDAHFSEVGLDSLLLTQAATAIDKQFDIRVTFRHLVEEYTCLKDLSKFVAGKVPMKKPTVCPSEVVTAAAAMQSVSSPVLDILPINISSTGNVLHNLVNAQLQIMQMQLQMLNGGTGQLATSQNTAVEPVAQVSSSGASLLAGEDTAQEGEEVKPKARHTPGTRITREVQGIKLTTAQKEWIDDILIRYQQKFAGSKARTQQYRKILADPRTVSGFNPEWKEIIFPIVTVKSKGSKLWDIDGNELIDTSNGFGPIFFGHSPDFVTAAVKEQIDKGIETGPQSPLAGEVAELFCELTGNERCTFACSGSEAVIGALRLARTVTGRSKVVMFEGSYHGIFDEVISRPGRAYQALPAAPGISKESTSNMLVLPWGEEESLEAIKGLGKELAAVLVESVQSRKPAFHSPEYIKALRNITTENGVALILDEVVTGFRVHPGGIRKRFDIDADLATYGKVVGGGYPIGIIGGKAKFMDALDGGYWQYGDTSIPESGVTFFAGTFVRHPLSLAAAKAVLTRIKAEGMRLHESLEAKTTQMAADAKAFIAEMKCEVTFEEFASVFYIAVPTNAHWGHLLFIMMTLAGIHIQQYRPNFMTTEHSEADVQKILSAFKNSLADLIIHGLIEGDQVAAKKHVSPTGSLPPGARLGKNAQGEPAYFIEDPERKGNYLEVGKP